jgi:hypothetical protein
MNSPGFSGTLPNQNFDLLATLTNTPAALALELSG